MLPHEEHQYSRTSPAGSRANLEDARMEIDREQLRIYLLARSHWIGGRRSAVEAKEEDWIVWGAGLSTQSDGGWFQLSDRLARCFSPCSLNQAAGNFWCFLGAICSYGMH
jgi:hypothetical protein